MKNDFTHVPGSGRMLAILIALTFFSAGSSFAQAVAFEWVKAISGSEDDYGYRVAADRMGNVYMAGYYKSSALDFNPGGSGGAVTNAGNEDVFLIKYDAGGNFLWVKNIGGSATENVYGLTIDKAGNVIMTGSFTSSTLDFDPGGSGGSVTGTGSTDAYLVKYDTGGNFVWAKVMGGSGTDVAFGVTTDTADNVIVTGYFASTDANFNIGGTGGAVTNAGANDVFLAKYDAGGSFLWAKSMGGARNDYSNSVAVDGTGNIYITGRYGQAGLLASADFNPGGTGGTVTSLGNLDVYIAKYDAAGNFRWVKSMGGANNQEYAIGIVSDAVGNVYFTGWYQSTTADFNIGGTGGVITKTGSNSTFLAAYDSAGNFRWVRNIGGAPGYTQPLAIALSSKGNLYLTGWSTAPVPDFDPGGSTGTLPRPTGAADNGAYLAEYDTSGSFIWVKGISGTTQSGSTTGLTPGVQGYGVAIDWMGNIYMTGWFLSNAAQFDPGSSGGAGQLTSVKEDGFLVKFACSDTSSFYISDSTCDASYTLNGVVYTATGTYVQHFPNAAGCDSTITFDLVLTPIDKPIVNVNQFVLSTSATYDSYQWIRNDTIILGATTNTYTVTSNGKYKVAVTNDKGCADTSTVYTITNVSVDDIHAIPGQIRVYPNPAGAVVYINSPVKVNIRLTDMAGRLIKEQADAVSVPIGELGQGLYLLHVADEKGTMLKTEKLIKLK